MTKPSLFSAPEIEQIHKTLARFPYNSQLSIARVEGDATTFYGAIRNEQDVQYTENSSRVFDIGSVAKVFTSAILAELVVQNELSLEDDASKLLDIPFNQNNQISLKQLASHTSGLPRLPPGLLLNMLSKKRHNPYAEFDEQKLNDYVTTRLKLKKPGKFAYSNLGAGILGRCLAKHGEGSYESMLQSHICSPVGLPFTTTEREKVKDRLVMGQNRKGKPLPYWDLSALIGAGGIYSCTSDLARFISVNMNDSNRAFALQRKEAAIINKQMSVGLGWFIRRKSEGKDTLYFHDGGSGGFTSLVLMNADKRTAVIILSNISPFQLYKASLLPKLARALYQNVTN